MVKKMVSLLFLFFWVSASHATVTKMDLDLLNVNLPDALHLLAKTLNINMMLMPDVSGTVSLHLKNVSAERALELMLATHGLTKILQSNIWLIGPKEELLREQQANVKLQEATDAAAPLATMVWRIRYAKADTIAHLLQDNTGSLLSKRGLLHVDLRTNTIYARDIADHLQTIHHVIQQLDVPVQQVMIETKLVSIDSDYERQLGIHFSEGDNAVAAGHYRFAVVKLPNHSVLDIELAALENEGHGELISSPRLFTANQQMASIESGEEIPYQEISVSGATGVAFKKAVLSLHVTPQVLPNNMVLLQLQINQDKPSQHMVQGVPAISTRQLSTHILAKNGQTVVLGGIFETVNGDSQQRIPILGKIPLVGLLFRQQNVLLNKRELLIFVTPILNTESSSEGKA